MKAFFLSAALILAFCFAAFAQTNQPSDCPTVSVRGGGVPRPNETTYFTADIDKKGKELKLEYVWSVSGGKIIGGQGTETITVKLSESDSLTASIEVKGFPEGCPNTASESVFWDDLSPKAVKFGEFVNFNTQVEKTALEKLKTSLLNDPNSQIYVIARFKGNATPEEINQKLKQVSSFLQKELAVKPERITIFNFFADREYTEIWLVPPGAENPYYDDYMSQNKTEMSCPTISVSGGGIILPPEPMFFKANVINYDLKNLTYIWSVTDGTISAGQGTPDIQIDTTGLSGKAITATVEIKGLPEGCNNSASEIGSVPHVCEPATFDEYEKISFRKEKVILDALVRELKKDKTWNAYFIIYVTKKNSSQAFKARSLTISKYLSETRKIPKERFQIVYGGILINNTKIYLVPDKCP